MYMCVWGCASGSGVLKGSRNKAQSSAALGSGGSL